MDAVVDAKRIGGNFTLQWFNQWYVYAFIMAFVTFVYDPHLKFVQKYYAKAYKIPSGGMMPTLEVGDHVLADKSISRGAATPQRGDVVIFPFPDDETKTFLKRIVGLPGETIEVREKHVYVNGIPLEDQAYTQHLDSSVIDRSNSSRDNFGPVTIPPGQYFVLGDNRDQSHDSRFWGFVDGTKIEGTVPLIYWSWDDMNSRVRWDRIGKRVE